MNELKTLIVSMILIFFGIMAITYLPPAGMKLNFGEALMTFLVGMIGGVLTLYLLWIIGEAVGWLLTREPEVENSIDEDTSEE